MEEINIKGRSNPMLNFNYSIQTEVFFGKDKIKVLPEQVKRYGNKVLLVYGGGSIKKNGLYDDVVRLLKENDILFWELSGVEPNPRIASVKKGVEICRSHGIELVLAVGGGSAIDCAKVVAAGVGYDGDLWDLVVNPRKIQGVLPIASILTLSATGSEMDPIAVISNLEINQKIGTRHPKMTPKFSILDPTYTFTVPRNQTAAGTVDIMSHVLENYFSPTDSAYLQNVMAEALLKTCIRYGKIVMEEPEHYEARANLMWCSSLAINGLLSLGKLTEWSVHKIEHELSAFYDITHGVGLAILFPVWMDYVLNDQTVEKFASYGINVWGLDDSEDRYEIARGAIEKTRAFFREMEMPATLREVGIDDRQLALMAKQATSDGPLGSLRPLEEGDVLAILKAAL